MTANDSEAQEKLNAAEQESEVPRPTLSFKTLTFSDGSVLTFEEDEIVVFVGPNNAGKSAALREMEQFVQRNRAQVVIKDATFQRSGGSAELLAYLQKHALRNGPPSDYHFGGMGFNINASGVGYFNNDTDRHPVAPFFAVRLSTEARIQSSNPAGAISLFVDPPSHPIHLLLMDPTQADKLSALFRRAFERDLIPFRAGGSAFPLFVGTKPTLGSNKDELSREFIEQLLTSTVRLEQQGDGMRSFAGVLLHVLAADTHSIQFLDEPEAFLHPPQARLLGEFIAKERRSKSQLFIATHSTDILDGLIAGDPKKVRIVRIQRDGNINRIRELSKEQTAQIVNDTLARYSGVLDGIFYEHVVICESDADCMFYSSMLRTKAVSGEKPADVLFIHAAGKHRMAALARTLKALDVPVSVIADIDVLNEEQAVKKLYETLGGDWNDISASVKAITTSVEHRRPPLNETQVTSMIVSALGSSPGTEEFPREKERAIKRIFKTLSPWDEVKRAGRSALSVGGTVSHFDDLSAKCSQQGLWIVPVGELEGFCRSIEAGHGPAFAEKVLEERDLETDHELSEARAFMSKIWATIWVRKT